MADNIVGQGSPLGRRVVVHGSAAGRIAPHLGTSLAQLMPGGHRVRSVPAVGIGAARETVAVEIVTREDIPEYAELRQRVELQVGHINGRFGEADWVPVRYLYRSYEHRVLAQLYHAADGLNLVAKEFIAAQDSSRPGVLVLSRFAGAAAELGGAVITNPYHPAGVAADMDLALRMPLAERVRRHALLATIVAGTTPTSWAAGFLGQLGSGRRLRVS